MYALDEPEQFVLTLQSYTVLAAKPLMATEVEAVAVAALVQVDEEVNL